MTELKIYSDAVAERGRKGEAAWLGALRRSALARFAELGLPTRRQEAWRFTNLRPLEQHQFPPARHAPKLARAAIADYQLDAANFQMIFVNGRGEAGLGSFGRPIAIKPGAMLASTSAFAAGNGGPLAPRLREEALGGQPFVALNTALFTDGITIVLPPGMTIDRPIEILHWGDGEEPASIHTRNILDLGPGSSATIIESFAGRGRYWTNDVTEIRLAEGASLRHIRLQDEGREAIHTVMTRVEMADAAHYDSFTLTLGAQLSRSDTIVAINGEKASCAVNGAYLLRRSQEATLATLIDHAAPGSETREVFKGVLEDRAHGVFQGKIQVQQAAQQTNAHQLNRNLLLSPRAAVDTKPELEIFADDVKCSHGATVGDLDENSVFYLVSRGIPETQARRMLVEAFAADALDLVADGDARSYLRRHLDRWLANRKD